MAGKKRRRLRRGVRHDLHPYRPQHGRERLRDGAEEHEPGRLALGPRRVVAGHVVPHAVAHLPVEPRDLLVQVHDEPQRVQGHVVRAVVRNVRDPAAVRRRRRVVYVVVADGHHAHAPQLGRRLERAGVRLAPLDHERVRARKRPARGAAGVVGVDLVHLDVAPAQLAQHPALKVQRDRASQICDAWHDGLLAWLASAPAPTAGRQRPSSTPARPWSGPGFPRPRPARLS